MAYYDALTAKWATLPSADTTAQKLAAINALAVAGPSVDVSVSSVVGVLILNGAYQTLKTFAAGSTTGVATHDAALAAAQTLINWVTIPNAPGLAMSNATVYAEVATMAAAILAQETAAAGTTGFTQGVHDALLALAATTIPWWQSAGYSSPIGSGDLQAAGLS